MRVLIDISHPAHVHFYRHLRAELLDDGHSVLVVARDKDVTIPLLDAFGIEYVSTGQAVLGSLARRAGELLHRVHFIHRQIRSFGAQIVLTRNPSGVQAAWIAGVPGVFDTDDGSAVGVHFWAAKPFARVITTPACLREDYGRRHRRYPGFKALAYLHPTRFTPQSAAVRGRLGIGQEQPLYVARFSAHTASHDSSVDGLSANSKQRCLQILSANGRVIVSDENDVASEFQPEWFHHLLAAADLCVGDSQSVAAEAAVLGTPAIRLSSFSGHVDYLNVLEHEYGLVRNFRPTEEEEFMDAVVAALAGRAELRSQAKAARGRLLEASVDVTSWYRKLVYEIVS